MAKVHRDTDGRVCGASTNAANPNVFTNNLLTAVDGNPNSHGGGNLNAANPEVYIGGKLVVLDGNPASPDAFCPIPPHCGPDASGGSPDVYIGG